MTISTAKIIKTGLLVGTLDIIAACLQFYLKTGRGPEPVLRYIASGAFGSGAFSGSSIMIFWGLFFHYLIAMSFTFLFFWLVKIFPSILKVKLITAVVYGIFMWVITQLVIVPLSKIPERFLTFSGAITAIGILIICIGIPLVWIAANQKGNPGGKNKTAA